MNKFKLTVNKDKMYIPLIYSDKTFELKGANGVYIYSEPTDVNLHSRNLLIAAVMKLNFGFAEVPVILYDNNLCKMPEHIQRFFIMHEVGHVMNKDLENISPEESNKIAIKRMLGILPEMEVKADAYAASVVGIDVAKEALSFLLKITNLPLITKLEVFRRLLKLK